MGSLKTEFNRVRENFKKRGLIKEFITLSLISWSQMVSNLPWVWIIYFQFFSWMHLIFSLAFNLRWEREKIRWHYIGTCAGCNIKEQMKGDLIFIYLIIWISTAPITECFNNHDTCFVNIVLICNKACKVFVSAEKEEGR